ncbi:hypothetical protein CCACVL1_04677 [Corchorus capsularis]|uniref:Uncharacterized protein n=1 Tax=Corchorus capsularis TaxID=210143 RepID=A0A1R3JQG3_COCAP|nr:hypothetical protein CCACVL1_04677 [Corchorus capsularis]
MKNPFKPETQFEPSLGPPPP